MIQVDSVGYSRVKDEPNNDEGDLKAYFIDKNRWYID